MAAGLSLDEPSQRAQLLRDDAEEIVDRNDADKLAASCDDGSSPYAALAEPRHRVDDRFVLAARRTLATRAARCACISA
jgi:hypothetical protein